MMNNGWAWLVDKEGIDLETRNSDEVYYLGVNDIIEVTGLALLGEKALPLIVGLLAKVPTNRAKDYEHRFRVVGQLTRVLTELGSVAREIIPELGSVDESWVVDIRVRVQARRPAMRLVLTGPIWDILAPLVEAAKRSRAGAKAEIPDRHFLEAVLYRARTGLPWRDLPADFGDWNAVFQRSKRWRKAGVWDRLFASLPTDSPAAEVKRLFFDSTIVRAHSHAAGAKKKRTRLKKHSDVHAAASPLRSTWSVPTKTRPSPSI
jgi:putative transposase